MNDYLSDFSSVLECHFLVNDYSDVSNVIDGLDLIGI